MTDLKRQGMTFHLGMDAPALWRNDEAWLKAIEGAGVTIMVSHGRLRRYAKLRPATVDWVCDSRGFSELSDFGRWTISPEEYAEALRRYSREAGRLQWASPQDWMCEPFMLAKTGLTVEEHQNRTVASVIRLRRLLGTEVHVIPVLQGWKLADYLRCVELYTAAGIDLTKEAVVGLGSVCRRQSTQEIGDIVRALSAMGIRLHGFGVKTEAMDQYGHLLTSADSFAWSKGARHRKGDCVHGIVKLERNCPLYALEWREEVLARLPEAAEPELGADAGCEMLSTLGRKLVGARGTLSAPAFQFLQMDGQLTCDGGGRGQLTGVEITREGVANLGHGWPDAGEVAHFRHAASNFTLDGTAMVIDVTGLNVTISDCQNVTLRNVTQSSRKRILDLLDRGGADG